MGKSLAASERLTEARGRPFRREGLWRRIAVFAIVAAAAEASLALPPGPVSAVDTALSVALLVAAGLAIWFAPWDRLPEWLTLLVPVAYTVSILFLILAAGGSTSGVGVVVLIPLVWTALRQERWQSLVVVAAIVVVQFITALLPTELPTQVIARRVTFWAVLGMAVAFAIHDLRDRLGSALAQREGLLEEQSDQLRRVEALANASEELTAGLAPEDIIAIGLRLASELVSPNSPGRRRAQYVRVADDIAYFVDEFDERGDLLESRFPLSEHPALGHAFESGEASHGPLDPLVVGPSVAEIAERAGVTHSVYVPLHVAGRVDGVLVVSIRGDEASPALFEECKAVGHVVELALGRAYAHQRLEELARTDPLTGLANRRAFEADITQLPGRGSYAVLVIDLDELKIVNDSEGHVRGDELIVKMANAAHSVLRRGDLLARVGGDEFAMLCFEADEDAARRVAERLLSAFEDVEVAGRRGRASIGLAVGRGGVDGSAVVAAADDAMYQAKAAGGGRYAVSPFAGMGVGAPLVDERALD